MNEISKVLKIYPKANVYQFSSKKKFNKVTSCYKSPKIFKRTYSFCFSLERIIILLFKEFTPFNMI